MARDIRRGYLVDESGDAEPRFKLKPVKDDAKAYERLFEGEDFIEKSNLTVNYRYFMEKLPKMGLSGEEIWEALSSLEVMQLDLEKDDNPQRIFESLNSTGLELSEADKARNLILMGLPIQEQIALYEKFWNRMEKNVDFKTPTFLRWYLVTKTGATPRQDSVYTAFKTFMANSGLSNAEVAADLRKYSVYYQNYREANTSSPTLNRQIARLNSLGFDVVVPFVMALLNAQQAGEIDEEDAAQSLRVLESYLFRRYASSIPTSALNKIMASLFSEVEKLRGDEDSFSDVLAYSLRRREGGGRFPTDAEFSEGFLSRNFYAGPPKRRAYLFDALENLDSNDVRDVQQALTQGSLTVEHIMPQTLSKAWKDALGPRSEELHSAHHNRIGNLTVTGYNSKYSNSDFATKSTTKDGFQDSPYRLNNYVKTADAWGPAQIEERGQQLLEDALSYWELPEPSFEPPVVPLPTELMGTDNDFTGRKIVAYEFQDASGLVDNWREAFVEILRKLMEIDPVAVLDRAQTGAWYHVGSPDTKPDGFWRVNDALSVFVGNSTQNKMGMLRDLFERLSVDPDDVTFTLRPMQAEPSARKEESHPQSERYLECKEIATDSAASSATVNSKIAREYVESFLAAFSQHRASNPADVLGASPLQFLKQQNALEAASDEQLLALVSSVVDANENYDDTVLWTSLNGGTILRYLERLG